MIDIRGFVVSCLPSCYKSDMSPENPTYTVLVGPSSYAGLVTARTSDGGNFRSRQPLLDGARYWVRTERRPCRHHHHSLVERQRRMGPARDRRPCR